MTHLFEIAFESGRSTRVHFALEPLDVFTGRIVERNVEVWLTARRDATERERLPFRAIRNSRGQLAFVNLVGGPVYFAHVRASRAGYLDPNVLEIRPPAPVADDAGSDDAGWRINRLVPVPLFPAPSFPFSQKTTLIRGRVVRTRQAPIAEPVARGRVWIDPLPPAAPSRAPFATLTDPAGAFALPIRLAPLIGADALQPVRVTLHIRDDDQSGTPPAPVQRDFDLTVRDGETHTLESAVDLSSTDGVRFAEAGDDTTRILGRVLRSGTPVVRARIWADPQADTNIARPVSRLSDEFGNFALVLQLPNAAPRPARVTVHVRDDTASVSPPTPIERTLTVLLGNRPVHAFAAPIDLVDTDPVPFVND